MTAQNEEKMREAFEKWFSENFEPQEQGTMYGIAVLEETWQAAIAQSAQERKQLESQLLASDAALKESRANDMESMLQLSESQKREAELHERVDELLDDISIRDEVELSQSELIANLKSELAKYKEAKPVATAWFFRRMVNFDAEESLKSLDVGGNGISLYAHPDNAKE